MALSIGFFIGLDHTISQRQWIEYTGLIIVYPLAMFILGVSFGHWIGGNSKEVSKSFHLTAFFAVNLCIIGWILCGRIEQLVWYPLTLIIWGTCLWHHLFQVGGRRQIIKSISVVSLVVFFLVLPISAVVYVLIWNLKDSDLMEAEKRRRSDLEFLILTKQLVDVRIADLKKELTMRDKENPTRYIERVRQHPWITAARLHDAAHRNTDSAGKRSEKVSDLLVNLSNNREEILTWVKSRNTDTYSHAYIVFVLQELISSYSEQALATTTEKKEITILADALKWEVSDNSKTYRSLKLKYCAVVLDHAILNDVAATTSSPVVFVKDSQSGLQLRVKLTGVEDTALSIFRQPHKGQIANSLSSTLPQWLSIFCIGWVSIVVVGIVLYSRYKDRLATEKLDLASTVAHEFRTPLTGMGVLIDSLIADPEKEPGKVHEYLLKMKSSTQRLHQISEHFFIEGSLKQKNLKLETIEIYQWLNEQWIEFTHLHKNEHIDYQNKIAKSSDLVLIDSSLCSLALQNILRNAHHYTKKGTISLSVSVTNSESGNQLGIQVTDTGKGMSNSLIKSACDKYTRGEDSLSRKTEGLGLGLHLSQEIAYLHEGKIEINSDEGQGTSVTLWIKKD